MPSKRDKHERLKTSTALRTTMTGAARGLRQRATPSEALLWQALRNKQLGGRRFRRQQPIGPFVVDFFCAAEQLVVEVDGPIHDRQGEADAERQQILEALGYRVLRLSAELVETDLAATLRRIEAAFGSQSESSEQL